jgi:hypothetical protein
MITDQDVEKLKETFATKEDLANFATKEDLANLSNVFATKNEFQELKEDVHDLKENMQVVVTNVDKILKKLDEQEYAVLKMNDSKQDAKL